MSEKHLTFEEYMLQNGMHAATIPKEDLPKWKAKYALGFPAELPTEPTEKPNGDEPPKT